MDKSVSSPHNQVASTKKDLWARPPHLVIRGLSIRKDGAVHLATEQSSLIFGLITQYSHKKWNSRKVKFSNGYYAVLFKAPNVRVESAGPKDWPQRFFGAVRSLNLIDSLFMLLFNSFFFHAIFFAPNTSDIDRWVRKFSAFSRQLKIFFLPV